MSENIAKDKIIKMLVKNGANVNSKNIIGHTPLMFAAYYSNVHIVSFLIEHAYAIERRLRTKPRNAQNALDLRPCSETPGGRQPN